MNKITKITFAVLGGVETIFTIAMPILVALLWVQYSSLAGTSAYILLGAGIIASFFRAIKVGWLVE